MTVPSVLLSVFMFFIGFGTKWFEEWYRHRYQAAREKEARHDARREQLLWRQADFQRQNLLDLQDAVMRLARTSGQIHHHDSMAAKQTGSWGRNFAPEGVSEAHRDAQATTTVILVRIRDKKIRTLTQELKAHCASAGIAESESASLKSMISMNDTFELLNERIGDLLRNLEDLELREK